MSKEAKTKTTQVIRQFFAKAALVISESRVVSTKVFKDSALNTPLVNKWFNLELDESEEIRESLRLWKSIELPSDVLPPPLVVETYLDLRDLGPKHNVYLTTYDTRISSDDLLGGAGSSGAAEKQFKVTQGGKRTEIVLERWIVQFVPSENPSADSPNCWEDKDLQPTAIYKQAAILIRSLYTYAQILPVWTLRKKLNRSKLTVPPLRIGCRVLDGSQRLTSKGRIGLTKKLTDNIEELESIYFPDLKTPFGSIKISASHRIECDFSIIDTEDFLSHQFFMQDNNRGKRPPSSPSSNILIRRQSTSSTNPASFPSPSRSSLEGSSSMASRNNVYRNHAKHSTDLSNDPYITSPTELVARDRRLSSVSLRDSPMNSPLMMQQPHAYLGTSQSPSSSRPQVSLVQPFKTPSLSASPSDSSLSSRPQSFSRTTSNSSLAALRIPNRTMSNASTSSVGSYSRGQGPENAISSSVSSSKSNSAPKFSSSFGSRGAWNRSGSLSGVSRPKRLSTELPGSLGSQGSFGPSSSLLVGEPDEPDDDQGLNAFLHMVTNIGQTRSASHNSMLLSDASSGSNSSFLLGSRTNLNSNSPSDSDILSRFQNMKDSHSALSESLMESAHLNNNKLSESPTATTSTTNPFPIPNTSPPQMGKTVTQHTPSVPSRLSEEFTANESFKAYYYSHPRKQNSLSSLKVDEEEIFPQEAEVDEQKRRSSSSKVNPLDIPLPSSKPFRRESLSVRNSHTSGYTDMQVMPKTSHHQSLGAVGGGAIFPGKELSSFRLKPTSSNTSIDNTTSQIKQLNLTPVTTPVVATSGSRRNSTTSRFSYYYDNDCTEAVLNHRRSDGDCAVDDDVDDSQKYNSDDEDNDVFYFALNEGDVASGGPNNGNNVND